jgi:hypothetical protein
MDAKVEQLLMMNASKFPPVYLPMIRQRLESCNPQNALVAMSRLKDPTISLILSILLGGLGVDSVLYRFCWNRNW